MIINLTGPLKIWELFYIVLVHSLSRSFRWQFHTFSFLLKLPTSPLTPSLKWSVICGWTEWIPISPLLSIKVHLQYFFQTLFPTLSIFFLSPWSFPWAQKHAIFPSNLYFSLETFVGYLLFASASAGGVKWKKNHCILPLQARGRALLRKIVGLEIVDVMSYSALISPVNFHNTSFPLTR